MGLDMYLFRMRKQKNKNFNQVMELKEKMNDEKLTSEEREEISPYIFHIDMEVINYSYDDLLKEVYYWRKANAIHKWFVENVQDDEDDCGYYRVTENDLEKLIKDLQEVYISLKDKETIDIEKTYEYNNEKYIVKLYKKEDTEVADCVLPTQEGFFFGDTSYNNYYFEMVEQTLNDLRILKNSFDFDNNYLVYSSSW